jgi:hypothetical protein
MKRYILIVVYAGLVYLALRVSILTGIFATILLSFFYVMIESMWETPKRHKYYDTYKKDRNRRRESSDKDREIQ